MTDETVTLNRSVKDTEYAEYDDWIQRHMAIIRAGLSLPQSLVGPRFGPSPLEALLPYFQAAVADKKQTEDLVSLTEPKQPEPARAEPWPADAVLWDAKDETWTDAEGIDHIGVGAISTPPSCAAAFRRSKFIRGKQYQYSNDDEGIVIVAMEGAPWLCVRDYVGPEYCEPEDPKPEPMFKVGWLEKAMARVDQVTIGGAVYEFASAEATRGSHPETALGFYEDGKLTMKPASTPVTREPDMLPPHIAKARGRTFVVPTDIDDSWIPDADDETMSGRLRCGRLRRRLALPNPAPCALRSTHAQHRSPARREEGEASGGAEDA